MLIGSSKDLGVVEEAKEDEKEPRDGETGSKESDGVLNNKNECDGSGTAETNETVEANDTNEANGKIPTESRQAATVPVNRPSSGRFSSSTSQFGPYIDSIAVQGHPREISAIRRRSPEDGVVIDGFRSLRDSEKKALDTLLREVERQGGELSKIVHIMNSVEAGKTVAKAKVKHLVRHLNLGIITPLSKFHESLHDFALDDFFNNRVEVQAQGENDTHKAKRGNEETEVEIVPNRNLDQSQASTQTSSPLSGSKSSPPAPAIAADFAQTTDGGNVDRSKKSREFSSRTSKFGPYIDSLVVQGQPREIIAIHRRDPQDGDVLDGFRSLRDGEKKDLETFLAELERRQQSEEVIGRISGRPVEARITIDRKDLKQMNLKHITPTGKFYKSLMEYASEDFFNKRIGGPAQERSDAQTVKSHDRKTQEGTSARRNPDQSQASLKSSSPLSGPSTSSPAQTPAVTVSQSLRSRNHKTTESASKPTNPSPDMKGNLSSDLTDLENSHDTKDDGDSSDESISEVTAKRQAGRPLDPNVETSKPKHKQDLWTYFDETLNDEDEYRPWWADPSVSDTVKEFVDEREEIFALQRTFLDYAKEKKAIAACTTGRKNLSIASHRSYLDQLSTYVAFCHIIKLNPFPISTAMIAVYLYQYRAQWPEEPRESTFESLKVFERWTNRLYETDHQDYQKLDQWLTASEVVTELQKAIQPSSSSSRSQSASVVKQPSPATQESIPKPSTSKNEPPSPSSDHFSISPFKRDRSRALRPRRGKPTYKPTRQYNKTGPTLNKTRPVSVSVPTKTPPVSRPPSPSLPVSAKRRVRRNIPLPAVGDRFESSRAVKMSTAAAVIFSSGFTIGTMETSTTISVYCRGPGLAGQGCSFRIVATLDDDEGKWMIVERTASHSHKPFASLVNDPEWRPNPIDPDLVEVIRQVDEKGTLDDNLRTVKAQKRIRRESNGEAPVKKPRTASPPNESTTATGSISGFKTFESSNRPSPASLPRSTPGFFLAPCHPPRTTASLGQRLEATPTLDAPEDPFFKKTQKQRPLDLSLPPIPHLAHFFTALDSSLTPLAPLFQAAGYSTLDSLVQLAFLSPRVRKLIYGEILARLPPEVDVEARLFDLLERDLVEASETDWTS
ncbi:uncharacterized protein JCM6883_002898 [Sporobolomyces salmoneus]|uniref:uncharacterized protein n=1 Tax=Sporobolomyces salmoneus TaxID=183962 RepID=UPI00317CD74D